MQINIYQVDAFASKLFGGNPAAVCPLDSWLPDELLQKIALENNLSETAFFVREPDSMHIRWFTPWTEVELCGHATLATTHVLVAALGFTNDIIRFQSQSGELKVKVEGDDYYTLDFPADNLRPVSPTMRWAEHFDVNILSVHRGNTDYIFEVATQREVEQVEVDFNKLMHADGRGFILTAPGDCHDYVARCFYPQTGVNEDPATGSSQTTLAVFWAQKLGKTSFSARQLSSRIGDFRTELRGARVLITGKAVSYLVGHITI